MASSARTRPSRSWAGSATPKHPAGGWPPTTFLRALDGVETPRKRKTIGKCSSTCSSGSKEDGGSAFSRARHALSRTSSRARPPRRPAVTIKTHHNVGGLPERMPFPRRAAARTLQGRGARGGPRTRAAGGFSAASVPGPGLAVRVTGDITRRRSTILRQRRRHRDRRGPSRRVSTMNLAGVRGAPPGAVRGRDGRRRTYEHRSRCAP